MQLQVRHTFAWNHHLPTTSGRWRRFAVGLLGGLVLLPFCSAHAFEFKAGTGRADIRPKEPVPLAGYAARSGCFTRIEERIWAKALALQDTSGSTTLIVTADTIGTPRWFNDALAERVAKELGVPRERFLFAGSHCHSTPVVKGGLEIMYTLKQGEAEAVDRYAALFLEQSFAAAQAALTNLQPVTLAFGRGEAHFAINRRQFGKTTVGIGLNPTGLVDNDVPVLRVEGTNGSPVAVVFGYACHCTTQGATYDLGGDWAGYAQECLERAYPGATALFMTGCGADANPNPRNNQKYVPQHGLALAGAVARVLNDPMQPVDGPIRAAFDHADLPFAPMPARAYFEAKLTNSDPVFVRFGRKFLGMMDRGEALPKTYPCPVQVLRFGKDLTLVALGGEVVVDYSYRLRRELASERLWAAAYCNDVFAYVPSMRILIEGGYEADTNLIYYGLPTRFAPEVEDTLVKKVLELARRTKGAEVANGAK
ncbi:MAG TPA: neutral/alkaline non-lysosomal ceramidase N-terminal domain-containing protein [Candidatus Acidoferrum sp.]|nr:neutral/alkaline non-lysosomal ceramidase N-terminal domain-containing protein [Candidatus Acidoferrum sp.]